MSTHPTTRSRWMDWKPKARILADTAEREPTKPSKPGFVGFEGATSAKSPKIEALSERAESRRLSTPDPMEASHPMETPGIPKGEPMELEHRSWAGWKAA